jgi:hypothetical protein
MNNIEEDINAVKSLSAKVCENHKISFIGFFQNQDKSFERMITEGIDCKSPNGSFDTFSFSNLTNNSDIQNLLSTLLHPSKNIASTSSPKQIANSSMITTSNSFSLSSASNNSSNLNKSYKTINVDPHNRVEVKNYLYNCFEEFQQIPCKLLAKSWIKIIEPKKQSKYPYKIGDDSKPFWWPSNCIHREPDHLKKDERINLLINILRIFKQKEAQLIYAASLINGLGSSASTSNKKDEFGERKLNLMKDMFKVLNAQSNSKLKIIKVIRPGKKYSSQFYQRNSNNFSIPISKSIDTPAKQKNTIKFPNFLVTPPNIKPSDKIEPNKLLPGISSLNHNNQDYYYNEMMELMSNKPETEKQYHFEPYNNSLLSSPFVPSMKIPNSTIRTPLKSNEILNSTPFNITENNIDPNFFQNDSTCLKNLVHDMPKKLNSVNSNFKVFDYQISPPPTGIFTTPKSSCKLAKTQILNSLNPSKINSLNLQLQNIINGDSNKKISKKDVQKFELNKNKQPVLAVVNVDENDETDYEMD